MVKADVARKEEGNAEVSGQDEVMVEVSGDEAEVETSSKADDEVADDCQDEVRVAALVMPTDIGSSTSVVGSRARPVAGIVLWLERAGNCSDVYRNAWQRLMNRVYMRFCSLTSQCLEQTSTLLRRFSSCG